MALDLMRSSANSVTLYALYWTNVGEVTDGKNWSFVTYFFSYVFFFFKDILSISEKLFAKIKI